ncbi:Protein-glutamine gamma-glutamyltransferase [Corynebacterium provencense]|uniref:Protein-glutamine gamma-glutamyltransferase n=1 Tax=Corynebacterium provencense TaxID=1737425 RepID=A0A2Z3YQ52_9CORY|nr:transglutaminase family protein [Corynebacterium provencense]AWT26279.1 Protein-glutamine gamma-glutamyltransferase [Corynebacterium provencense]
MTTTLRIVHTTGYNYSDRVTDSFNEIRMTPLYTPQQLIREQSVTITPKPWSYSFIDYWGTHVTSFEIHEPHDQMIVGVTTTLDVDAVPATRTGMTLGGLRDHADALNEYLCLSPMVAPSQDLLRRAREIANSCATVDETALAVGQLVFDEMTYETGASDVTGTAAQAWDARKGVCQDFSHIMIGALRAVGIPARYVSGYVLPKKDAGIGETVDAESHAWVQWFNGGDNNGWYSFDPTNDLVPGELHVIVGTAREYSDVPPLKGMFSGQATSELFVTVRMTRLG